MARGQLVTWIEPAQNPRGLSLQSVFDDVEIELTNSRSEAIDSVGDVGWTYDNGAFGPVLRAGQGRRPDGTRFGSWRTWGTGNEVKVTVQHLPPGNHRVFLRYWAEAPGPSQMHYALTAALDDRKLRWFGHDDGGIVRGLGGYEGAIYEAEMGTVEASAEDGEVVFRFKRSRHSFIAKFAGVRIETTPNADVPRTSGSGLTEAERLVRQRLLSQGPSGESIGIGTVPATLKVRPKRLTDLVDVEVGDAINLSAARGEYVSGQIVVFSPDRDLPVQQLEVYPLTHEGGEATITAENAILAPVGYLMQDTAFDLDRFGWWPEPILEFFSGGFTVGRGDLQTLWYRIHIPRDALAGRYTSRVVIRTSEGGPSIEVPLRLTVWDFEVPRVFSFHNAITTSYITHTPGGAEFLLDYGINPGSIYRGSGPTKEDLEAWAADGRLNAFNVRYFRWKNGLPPAEKVEQVLDEVQQTLEYAEAVGLRDKAYFYMFDEAKRNELTALEAFSRAVEERFPDLLMLTTATGTDLHGLNSDLPHIDGWTPRIPKYEPAKARRAREQYGRKVWWYTANTPRPPYVNFWLFRLPCGF